MTVGKWPLINKILARFARTMAISVLHCFSNEIGMISSGEVLAGMTWIRRSTSAMLTGANSYITEFTD